MIRRTGRLDYDRFVVCKTLNLNPSSRPPEQWTLKEILWYRAMIEIYEDAVAEARERAARREQGRRAGMNGGELEQFVSRTGEYAEEPPTRTVVETEELTTEQLQDEMRTIRQNTMQAMEAAARKKVNGD